MKTKTFKVKVKALKSWLGKLALCASGAKKGELNMAVESNLALMLTQKNHAVQKIFGNDQIIDEEFGVASDCYSLDGAFQAVKGLTTRTLESIKKFDVSKVKDMTMLFYGYDGAELDVFKDWDTSSLENLTNAFSENPSLKSLDLSSFNTNKLQDMKWAFLNDQELEYIDLTGWNTSKVQDFDQAFAGCLNLKEIKGVIDLASAKISLQDGEWDANDAFFMFSGCPLSVPVKLKNVPMDMDTMGMDPSEGYERPLYEMLGFVSQNQYEIVD